MTLRETESNPTGSNICIYNHELLLLVAENEEIIFPDSVQQMSEICFKHSIHSVFSLCQKLGWDSERLRRDKTLTHCRFYYPPQYSPQDDIATLQSDCLIIQTDPDSSSNDQPYYITADGEREAARIRSHLLKAMKKWKKESRKNLPSFWQGEIFVTAQPAISTIPGPTESELVIRAADPKPLNRWEKILFRLPFLPIV